ncbi:flagellar biosynthetic protein FliR [Rhizobium sp. BK251]|uniref:flagellar biosynthetic protein FliR n=1 Tax=Rhizobium sp. BK251 TaxID=2512125 RepID=UPI00104A21EE|nr:flagellar biosynthetic protein FliR [Rhizobium sp. BK251]TCL75648.1 flagellar biosynthetic protein FliR [Rhizobium sp. BK251]
MISDPQGTILALFIAFCRIGTCVMILPGFSSSRIPVQIRLLIAVALSMAMLPVLWDTIYPRVSAPGATYIGLIFTESLVGAMYGMLARLYTLGLQFAGTIISMMIGYSTPGAVDIVEDTFETGLTNMITFSGLMLLFILDFHHIVFRALIDSYSVVSLGAEIQMRSNLISITDTLESTTYIMLRLSSPFILYGLMFNVSIGFINKLAPQIPVYFISTPYLLMGGLFMFYLSIAALVSQFADAFGNVFIGR